MVLIGCKPKGRLTEQHDVFFGIGTSLASLVAEMKAFWPESNGKIHIDAWRKATYVDGYEVHIEERKKVKEENPPHLYFVNLGGYIPGIFEEQHCKILTVADGQAQATQQAKKHPFYKQNSFEGAASHIDDKYGVDIDEMFFVQDALPTTHKERFAIQLKKSSQAKDTDETHIGYVKIADLSDE